MIAPGERRAWVISYDISDDRRRARLARFLEARGIRVQWSVFELVATPSEMAALLAALPSPERFDPVADSLRCYPLCANCRSDASVLGHGGALTDPCRPLVM